MKTTIKLTTSKSITVEPCKAGGVLMQLHYSGESIVHGLPMHLQPDQVGALIFAMEMCIEGSPETLNDKG